MLFEDSKLYGTCDLTLGGKAIKDTACALDLASASMMVQAGEPQTSLGLRQELVSAFRVEDIRLQTPYGTAICQRAEEPLLSAQESGGNWIGKTVLTRLFEEENKHFPYIRVLFNAPLDFTWKNQIDEVIVTPGLDTASRVQVSNIGQVIGRKKTLSVIDSKVDDDELGVAISLAVGAPVRFLAKTREGNLKLYLNTPRPELQPRPLFRCADKEGWWKTDLVIKGLSNVLVSTISYFAKIPSEEKNLTMDAIMVFLEGRANSGAFELKLLALVRFLEWFDGAKTFSKNALVERLNISQGEAEAIVCLRNQVIHNRMDLRPCLDKTAEELNKANPERFDACRGMHPHLKVLNYLFSVCGEALLRKIGFEGDVDDYFPKRGD